MTLLPKDRIKREVYGGVHNGSLVVWPIKVDEGIDFLGEKIVNGVQLDFFNLNLVLLENETEAFQEKRDQDHNERNGATKSP